MPIYVYGLIWAAIGLAVPILWGVLGFIFFNARNWGRSQETPGGREFAFPDATVHAIVVGDSLKW
jgi:hypothetical protein